MAGLRYKILNALAQTKGFVSGQQLAESCGVSRTAVWKHIQALRSAGYQIESTTNRGYRLVETETWHPQRLPEMVSGEVGSVVMRLQTTTSTNQVAKAAARQGAPHGTVVVADEQQGGRGRRGRTWSSPQGGIWVSIILRPRLLLQEVPLITLLAAVATCEAIREITQLPCKIKWPNDIVINGRKLAGILTELAAEQEAVEFCVVGIGINANVELSQLPSDLENTATTLLAECSGRIDRQLLLTAVCDGIDTWLHRVETSDWTDLLLAWRQLNATLNRRVIIYPAADDRLAFTGVAVDIDQYGALLVQKDDGAITRVTAGDVSIRNTGG